MIDRRPLTDDGTVFAILNRSLNSLTRTFYISLFLSLLASYILYEEWVVKIRPTRQPPSAIAAHIETYELLVRFNTLLRQEPDLLASHQELLEPFHEINHAARYAYDLHGNTDRWDVVDPNDFRIAIDPAINGFEDIADWEHQYASWKIGGASLINIQRFATLVFPDDDESSARRSIEASFRIANAFSREGLTLPPWPSAFYLFEYVLDNGSSQLIVSLERIRRELSANSIDESVSYLTAFCTSNNLQRDSLLGLDACFASDIMNSLRSSDYEYRDAEEDRIAFTFFPSGFHRSLILKLSPVVLLVCFQLLVTKIRLWLTLRTAICARYLRSEEVVFAASWTIVQALVEERCAGRSTYRVHLVFLRVFVAASLSLPLITQILVAAFFLTRVETRDLAFGGVALFSSAITAVGFIESIRDVWRSRNVRWRRES